MGWRPVAAFAGGLAITAAILAPALYPAGTYRLWCAVVHRGAVPSTDGFLVTLGPPPPGTAGPGGPWVALEVRNVGRVRKPLRIPERFGGELSFAATGAEGPVDSVFESETLASWLHTTILEPGERVTLLCNLSRWVRFPGPGTYQVRAKHHHVLGLEKAAVSVSNSFEILVD